MRQMRVLAMPYYSRVPVASPLAAVPVPESSGTKALGRGVAANSWALANTRLTCAGMWRLTLHCLRSCKRTSRRKSRPREAAANPCDWLPEGAATTVLAGPAPAAAASTPAAHVVAGSGGRKKAAHRPCPEPPRVRTPDPEDQAAPEDQAVLLLGPAARFSARCGRTQCSSSSKPPEPGLRPRSLAAAFCSEVLRENRAWAAALRAAAFCSEDPPCMSMAAVRDLGSRSLKQALEAKTPVRPSTLQQSSAHLQP